MLSTVLATALRLAASVGVFRHPVCGCYVVIAATEGIAPLGFGRGPWARSATNPATDSIDECLSQRYISTTRLRQIQVRLE